MLPMQPFSALFAFPVYSRWGRLLFAALLLALASCANPIAPSGGPKDTEPPFVLQSLPVTNTLGFTGTSVLLEFSEYVDKNKVNENIIISPSIPVEFEWSGRELEIRFTKALDSATTYAINLGTDYTDLYGNKPTQANTIIFSTGMKLDSGSIKGELYGPAAAGCYVFLYPLRGLNPDTLNPSVIMPRYRTQAGSNGLFEFNALPYGEYRLIAIRDEFKNGLYDAGTDGFGLPFIDTIRCEAGISTPFCLIQPGPAKDTTSPLWYDIKHKVPGSIELIFSENLDTNSISTQAFMLSDSSGQIKYGSPTAAFIAPNNGKVLILEYNTDRWKDGKVSIAVDSLLPSDFTGNKMKDSAGFRFIGISDKSDKIIPRLLSCSIQDSSNGLPLDFQADFVFSGSINPDAFAAAFSFTQDKKIIVPEFIQVTDNIMRIKAQLQSDMQYIITVDSKTIKDKNQNIYADSAIKLRFRTQDIRLNTVIKGELVDSLIASAGGPYILLLRRSDNKWQQIITIPNTGIFEFNNVPAGTYTIEAFQDKDKNQKYSYGSVFPYQKAERFIKALPAFTAKARWNVDGIKIIFK